MRLHLKPGIDSYVLIEPTAESTGVIIRARPAITDVIEQAIADPAILALGEDAREQIEGEDGQVDPDMIRSQRRVGLVFAKAIARAVIEEWEGIEDPDGKPAPVTPDRIDAFLDHKVLYDAFTEKYLARWLTVQAEKNDSAPSLTGTSAAAHPTAQRARAGAKSAPKRKASPKR